MNRFAWSSRSAWLVAMAACAVGVPHLARAEGSEDSLSLKIANALRPDKFFVRAGVIYVRVKTKSGETKDVGGPVVTLQELQNIYKRPAAVYTDTRLANPINFQVSSDPTLTDQANLTYLFDRHVTDPTVTDTRFGDGQLMNATFGLPLLTDYMDKAHIGGIGTPPGIKANAAPNLGTVGLSVGYFLDDDYKWLVESYVLAAPIYASVTVEGTTFRQSGVRNSGVRPIGISGVPSLITTKLVPPTVLFGRYWGDKSAKFRPYTGVMAMYAIFTDTKASQALNNYVGGSNPGDTTVSIKDTFGMGPVLGFKYQVSDEWHASLNVGYVPLKTQATLTTRNTVINTNSKVRSDLGGISDKIDAGEGVYNVSNFNSCSAPDVCQIVFQNGGLTSLIMKGIIAERFADGKGDGKSLGTYVRKTDTTLNNAVFMLSVGRSF